MTELREVDDLTEAVSLLELNDVIFYELHGQRRDGFDEELGLGEDNSGEPQNWRMSIFTSDDENALAIRGQLSTETPELVIKVDASVIFGKREPFALTPEVVRAFIDNVALMTMFPYHREAVHDLTMRLGHPVTLSLLRRRVDGAIAGLEDEPEPTAD